MNARLAVERFWFETIVGGKPRGRGTLQRWINGQATRWLTEHELVLNSKDLIIRFHAHMHSEASKAIASKIVDKCLDNL